MHVSWSIGWLCLGYVAGIACSALIGGYAFSDKFWVIIAASLTVICLVKRLWWTLVIIFAAGILFGLSRGGQVQAELRKYHPYYGQQITLAGRVAQDTSLGEKGDQRMNLRDVKINGTSMGGEVWASIGKADIKRGDIVIITGQLSEGFGNMSATIYRAQVAEIIRPKPGDIARRFRDWFGEGVRRAIPEPQSSLGLGYLVGQKTALPEQLEEDIKIVGLTHAVVASGYNLTILVTFSRALFMRGSKYLATFASCILVMCFMFITGLSPSMTRAGLVACLGLVVWYYGRATHPFVLLSFAAAMTVIANPSYVWGDLGWYLSFGSFIGVIVLAPLVQQYFWDNRENVPLLRQLFVDTMSAQFVTMPLILLSFGLFSVYALPANMMVLPLVPLAMLCTFIAGLAGLILPSIAAVAGFPATLILRYSTECIGYFAHLPGAQKEMVFNPALMIFSYIGISALIAFLIWRTKYDFRGDNQKITA